MAGGDQHGNRDAKKPKKLKPKEIGPISTLASIQKKPPEATNLKKEIKKTATTIRILGRRS